jgi:ribose transport system substrate-binding protein
MKRHRLAHALGGLAAATALLTAAACSSSSSSGTSAASGAGASSAGASGNGAADAATSDTGGGASAQLKAKVDATLKPPASIGVQTPLSRKPVAGKFIVGLLTPLAVAKTESDAQAAAAKALGWRYQTIQEGTGPQDPEQALAAAVALRPDGIIYYGTPRQPMAAALQKAQQAGIPVVATAQVDPLAPPIIANNSNSGPQLAQLGSGVADYVAEDSGLKAGVALVTLPSYPVLASFDNAFTHELESVCSGCGVTQLPQQLTDIGTNTPSSIVNAIRRNPSIKYVIFDTGSVATGVETALQAAGLSDVVVGGEAPSPTAIQEMKSGTDEVWAALSIPVSGYALVDALARYFDGDSLKPVAAEIPPWQLLTKDNIGSAVLDSQGNYIGLTGYQAAFAKLWNLG